MYGFTFRLTIKVGCKNGYQIDEKIDGEITEQAGDEIDEQIESLHKTTRPQIHVVRSALSFSAYEIEEDDILSIEANNHTVVLSSTITDGSQLTVTLRKNPKKKNPMEYVEKV
jgi:hypothetical protein